MLKRAQSFSTQSQPVSFWQFIASAVTIVSLRSISRNSSCVAGISFVFSDMNFCARQIPWSFEYTFRVCSALVSPCSPDCLFEPLLSFPSTDSMLFYGCRLLFLTATRSPLLYGAAAVPRPDRIILYWCCSSLYGRCHLSGTQREVPDTFSAISLSFWQSFLSLPTHSHFPTPQRIRSWWCPREGAWYKRDVCNPTLCLHIFDIPDQCVIELYRIGWDSDKFILIILDCLMISFSLVLYTTPASTTSYFSVTPHHQVEIQP